MKSVILYGSFVAIIGEPQQVIHIRTRDGSVPLFIRSKVVENCDDLHALSMAKPKECETVLNTLELPEVPEIAKDKR